MCGSCVSIAVKLLYFLQGFDYYMTD